MIVFGSRSELNSSVSNQTWSLSLSGTPVWTQLFPGGVPPSARGGHTAVYDSQRQRMLVFGGLAQSTLNDVWELTLTEPLEWHRLEPDGTLPPARWRHAAIYDPMRVRMLVFGGFGNSGDRADLWQLDLSVEPAVWSQIIPVGPAPSARSEHSAIFDPIRDRMIVFGGESQAGL
jgi:hypothetical protein